MEGGPGNDASQMPLEEFSDVWLFFLAKYCLHSAFHRQSDHGVTWNVFYCCCWWGDSVILMLRLLWYVFSINVIMPMPPIYTVKMSKSITSLTSRTQLWYHYWHDTAPLWAQLYVRRVQIEIGCSLSRYFSSLNTTFVVVWFSIPGCFRLIFLIYKM